MFFSLQQWFYSVQQKVKLISGTNGFDLCTPPNIRGKTKMDEQTLCLYSF